MSADPVPNENGAVSKATGGAVVQADPRRPFTVSDRLKSKRRVAWIILPKSVILPREATNFLRKFAVAIPETRRRPACHSSSARILSSGIVFPSRIATSVSFISQSILPDAKSAFICLSHSSSACGKSSANNSQYSCGDNRAIASLISATVLTCESSRISPQTARTRTWDGKK